MNKRIFNFINSKVWNRPTYEKTSIPYPESVPHNRMELQLNDNSQINANASSESINSRENCISMSNANQLTHSQNVKTHQDAKRSDQFDNRLTPAAANVLLPSPTLPRDFNQQILQNTPLKISVKKATKYLGLSKSLGIKVNILIDDIISYFNFTYI